MHIYRLYVIAAAVWASAVTASLAAAEFSSPSYPQRPPLVDGLRVRMPDSAELGSRIPVEIYAERRSGIDTKITYYVYLIKNGNVYFARSLAGPDVTAGRAVFGPYMVDIPNDIPAGEYEYRVGVYLDRAQATGKIELTGLSTAKNPKIVTTGCFTDKYGVPHHWFINRAHTLIWDGEPFIPAGGMFIYDRDWELVKAQIDLLKRYGVRDIYLHLGVNQPYIWKEYRDDDYEFFQRTIDYLDDNGFTYGIEFQALEAKGHGFSYPGGGARVDNVKSSGTVRAEEKNARSAVFIVEDKSTGEVVQTGTARVEGDFLEADVLLPQEGEYRVIFAADRPCPDDFVMYYWGDEYERYLEKIRSHYSRVRLGPGFRFLVDPLWNEMNTNHGFVPSAPAFAEQFARWLQERYGSVDELNAAWRPVGSRWPTFSAAGSTISIERIEDKRTGRLMQYAYSRTARRFYVMDACSSQFNYDVREFLGRSLLYYCNRVADEWKKLNDVPVIYKGFSDVDWWHINDTGLASGHDGLGMESYGTGEPMLMFMAAHLFGECEQATKTTWLIVTETGEGNHQDACLPRNKPIGYSDRLGTMYANFNALLTGGAKGIYHYSMIGGRGTNEPWTDNISRDPRQLEWLATYARILRNAPALVDYRPDMYFRFPALFNPCSMELYSEPCGDFYNMGGWWWREPIQRSQDSIWIVPSFALRPDTPMLIVNLENRPASERFAREVTETVEAGRRVTVIGFRMDPGTIPAIDRYYTGRFGFNERGRRFQVLRPTPSSRILNATGKGEVWNLIDAGLQINSEEVFGKHGYQPQNLLAGNEKPVDPYYGVFEQLLGVSILDLGPELEGLTFLDGGKPVTVVRTRGSSTRLELPLTANATARYPDGTPAGDVADGTLIVPLEPVNRKLVPARSEWAPEGIMVDSTRARDSVILENVQGRSAWVPSALRAVDAEADRLVSELPADRAQELSGLLASVRIRSDLSTQDYIEGIRYAIEQFFSRTAPYVWIEAESARNHNFNYSRLGGIPALSGTAFLGLETAVSPPTDTGWFAEWDFEVSQDGVYQLWVRENYLSFSSPCRIRVDNGEWIRITNALVPHDTRVVTHYNAVEDTRQIFAWYHYTRLLLTAGRHRLTLRVDEPRPAGTILTMAENRPFAKLIDCLLLTGRQFIPDGIARPRSLRSETRAPMVNLLPNPSVEYDADGDEQPDGWTPSHGQGLQWTRPAWSNIREEGLFDVNAHLRDSYAMLRSLRIEPGDDERFWRSSPIRLNGGKKFVASAWVRAAGPDASLRIVWLGPDGNQIRQDVIKNDGDGVDWREFRAEVTKPDIAGTAIFECVLTPGASGPARFDDLVFAAIADLD